MKTMDIRLKHTDITKAGIDSFERKSVDNSFECLDSTPWQVDGNIDEVNEDIVDKIQNFIRKFLTRISKLVNKP